MSLAKRLPTAMGAHLGWPETERDGFFRAEPQPARQDLILHCADALVFLMLTFWWKRLSIYGCGRKKRTLLSIQILMA